MTPREHIEHIRQTKFSIGGELNPLTEDLHEAVKNLAGELYAKDVHFFMELVQVNFHSHCYFLPYGLALTLKVLYISLLLNSERVLNNTFIDECVIVCEF